MIVSSALMIWKGLMVVTGSESPIVVVLRFVCIIEAFFTAFAFQLVTDYQVNCKVMFVKHKT